MFVGCSADTIMVVAWGPDTKDCVEAGGVTSVPWGVVITSPAERGRETMTHLHNHTREDWKHSHAYTS